MKLKLQLMALAGALILVAGCTTGEEDQGNGTSPLPPAQQSLTSLVHAMFAKTSDTALPIEIDNIPLDANIDDNPALYTNLLI